MSAMESGGWLVLSRKEHEEVVIHHAGESIRLCVTEAQRGWARIAFKGPASFNVARSEVDKGPDHPAKGG